MKQYLELLKTINEKGTKKPPAREGMPGSTSLFGYQNRYDLAEGFPICTTKEIYFKGVVVELIWFLRGDTNIKYLVDNGVNIWNEDAYNYYNKKMDESGQSDRTSFEGFVNAIKSSEDIKKTGVYGISNYNLGDCGFQYGKVWRDWEGADSNGVGDAFFYVDQIKNLINNLKNNPESRRHLVTAIDPAHDEDLALYWCHALFQFNCRPISYRNTNKNLIEYDLRQSEVENKVNELNLPKYYLDCQLYQRSADVVLGVPFNIASYALLVHILCKICNMVPGEFIHSFGDVHIYDNHTEAVREQLSRTPGKLPSLNINWANNLDFGLVMNGHLNDFFHSLKPEMFSLENYNPQPKIKAKLSTGLK